MSVMLASSGVAVAVMVAAIDDDDDDEDDDDDDDGGERDRYRRLESRRCRDGDRDLTRRVVTLAHCCSMSVTKSLTDMSPQCDLMRSR